jgi:parallel beta-helix repeat protein
LRKYSKYLVVAGALAALAAPSAAMAAGGTGGTPTDCTTLSSGPAAGLTAKVVGNPANGSTVDATGCDIGVYDPTGHLSGVTIHGATQYGVYVDKGSVDVTGANVNHIGDQPFDGMQYGKGIYYTGSATGKISGNTVSAYQKTGIEATGNASVSVTGNTVTGLGPVNFIAQNGIEIYGATATAMNGNTVSQNEYAGQDWTATGILFYNAQNAPKAGTISSANHLFQNDDNVDIVP